MSKEFVSIQNLLLSSENMVLQLKKEDLKEFANQILLGAKSIAMLAAKLLSVSKMTLYRWDQNGILKKVEIGGKCRYRKSDIERLAGCKM